MPPKGSRIAAAMALAAWLTAIALGHSAPGVDGPRKDRHGDPLPPGALGRLGTIRLRATADAMVVLPDGKTLVTVSGGRTVARWDAETGRLLGETHLPGPHVDESCISPDGQSVAVVEEGGISVWDVVTAKRLHFLPRQIDHCAFSPDGKTLATSEYSSEKDGPGTGMLHLWDLASGKDRVLAELHGYFRHMAFAPDGRRLYAAIGSPAWVRAWDLESGKELWGTGRHAMVLAVSPDSKTLFADDMSGNAIYLLDADSGSLLANRVDGQREQSFSVHLALSSGGKHALQSTSHGETLLWNLEQGTRAAVRFPDAGPRVAFAADGKSFFTAGKLLQRWDVATKKLLYADTRKDGHIGPVTSLAFAPDGRALASTGTDGTLRLWCLADASHRLLRPEGARELQKLRASRGLAYVPVCFTPDGRQVLMQVAFDTLAWIDATTGKEGCRFKMPHNDDVQLTPATARVSADGKTVLVQCQPSERPLRDSLTPIPSEPVFAWDAATGEQVLTRMVPGSFQAGAAFAPDGRLFFGGHGQLTDLRSGGQRPLRGGSAEVGPPSAFSADGRMLAVRELSGREKTVRIYETTTGSLIARAEGTFENCRGVTFSRDGRLVAAPGRDALQVWEAATGKLLLRLEAKGRLTQWDGAAFATCLAFAPDGKALATGHADGTILLWDLAKAWANLTPAPGPVDVEACWADLALADAAKAQIAIERLSAVPAQSLPLLKQKIGPVVIEPPWLASRLEDLGSTKFTVREAAMRDLEKVGDVVETDLRRLLERPPSLEVRARLLQILKVVDAGQAAVPPLAEVRKLRALAVLERIGTPEALAHLRDLAGGAPEARLTQEAKAALTRLDQRR